MTTRNVRVHRSLAAARAALDPQASTDLSTDTFLTFAWFENLAAHGIDTANEVHALQIDGDADHPGVVLPLLLTPRTAAALYGPAWTSLSNYYSSLFGPAGLPEACTPDACRAALRQLRRAGRGVGVMDLQPLDQGSQFYRSMLDALRQEGYLADTYFCFGNWHLEVDGRTFQQYFQTVPTRIRNTIKRARKKLDEAGAWDLRIETGMASSLEQAITEFDAVYRRSWKVPEPFPDFVPNLIRTAARNGWLRLGIVRLSGVPIAAQLWLVRNKRALIYKLAYDEDHKRLSAGSVLTAEMMRHAIDADQVDDIDYLTGDDAYKADWMSHRRERRGIVAFDPRSLQGLVSAVRHFGGRWLRRMRRAATNAAVAPTPAATDALPAASVELRR